jgi:hypothetical protein
VLLLGEVFALVPYVYVPVAFIYVYGYTFMTKIPSYIIVIAFVFGRLDRERKVPAAHGRAVVTQNLLCHYDELQIGKHSATSAGHYKLSAGLSQEMQKYTLPLLVGTDELSIDYLPMDL